MTRALALLVAAGMVLSGCGDDPSKGDADRAAAVEPTVPATISVTSSAFDDGEVIPEKYTCHGGGDAPEIQWSGLPSDAGSVAVVVDDPDAPGAGYVHWVVVGLPTGRGGLDAEDLPEEAREVDGSGGPGWSPPCPPSGTHHYRFTVYAFSASGPLQAVSGKTPLAGFLSMLADDAIAWGRLTGTVSASGGDTGGGY